MRKPTKKYFLPSFGSNSIMYMRKWMDSGATVADIVRWINMEYVKAKDVESREHLGMMICAAMSVSGSYSARKLAGKCAEMFGIPIDRGMSVGENVLDAMIDFYDRDRFIWLEVLNPYFVKQCPLLGKSAPDSTVTDSLTADDHRNLVTIDARYSVYFMRDADGRPWLIAVNRCNNDMLVDEESFSNEPPLYFTESKHFVSPVWIIRQVSAILEYILMRIGYPPFHIYKRVIFEEPEANLINEEDYLENEAWRDVDVVTLHQTKGKIFPVPAVPVVDVDKAIEDEDSDLRLMLYFCLMATAEVLEGFDIARYPEITRPMIEEWCRKSCIFHTGSLDPVI